MRGGKSRGFKYIGYNLNNPLFYFKPSLSRMHMQISLISFVVNIFAEVKFVSLLSPKPFNKMIPNDINWSIVILVLLCSFFLAIKETVKYIK